MASHIEPNQFVSADELVERSQRQRLSPIVVLVDFLLTVLISAGIIDAFGGGLSQIAERSINALNSSDIQTVTIGIFIVDCMLLVALVLIALRVVCRMRNYIDGVSIDHGVFTKSALNRSDGLTNRNS